jgi:hypothetical protein
MVTSKKNKAPNTNTQARHANKQYTGVCNMGAYCHSHRYHPASKYHNSMTCKYKKDGHNKAATWNNILGGNDHWPATTSVAITQQNHGMFKNKTKPTVRQGPGIMDSKHNNNAALNEIMQSLHSNHYTILSLPPCQVKNPPLLKKDEENLHSISPKATRAQTEMQTIGNVASKIEPKQRPIKLPYKSAKILHTG